MTALLLLMIPNNIQAEQKPWEHGRLQVSDNQRFLQHADGTPFFWLGETAWLMPERLNREEVSYYLDKARDAGYNMIQVQVLNDVPSINAYGQPSHDQQGNLLTKADYGYWDHMDYIVSQAEQRGIYIGMVCIWGGVVKAGKLSVEQAKTYGSFLANRYKNHPNIIWIIGGDIQGDIKADVWETLATTIKSIDNNHLMTYHPRGRYTSAKWWSRAAWIDFHTFQSGHRKYGPIPYPTIRKRTTGCMWIPLGPTNPRNLSLTMNLFMRAYLKGSTILMKVYGSHVMCVVMPIGVCLQAVVGTPMAIMPSCSSTSLAILRLILMKKCGRRHLKILGSIR